MACIHGANLSQIVWLDQAREYQPTLTSEIIPTGLLTPNSHLNCPVSGYEHLKEEKTVVWNMVESTPLSCTCFAHPNQCPVVVRNNGAHAVLFREKMALVWNMVVPTQKAGVAPRFSQPHLPTFSVKSVP